MFKVWLTFLILSDICMNHVWPDVGLVPPRPIPSESGPFHMIESGSQ